MEITLTLPTTFIMPDRLKLNNPELNAEIITLGNIMKSNQEEVLKNFYLDEEILKIKNENKLLKNNKLQDLNNYYNEGLNKGNTNNNQLIDFLKNTIEEERLRNKELLNNIYEKQNIEFNKMDEFLRKYKVSTHIGEFGENFIDEYFKINFLTRHKNPSLTNVSYIKGQGDLHYIDNNFKLLIEVKNKSIMTKEDINKFYDNITECYKNGTINAGILISLQDTYLIDNQKGLVFEWYKVQENDIPLIYISNVINNHDLIKLSVNILGYLIDRGLTKFESKSNEKKILINSIEEIYKKFCNLKKILEKNKKFINFLEEQNKDLENIQNSIFDILIHTSDKIKDIHFNFSNIKNEIYDKVKLTGKKATKKTLINLGYTEEQIKTIKIRNMNEELFNKSMV